MKPPMGQRLEHAFGSLDIIAAKEVQETDAIKGNLRTG